MSPETPNAVEGSRAKSGIPQSPPQLASTSAIPTSFFLRREMDANIGSEVEGDKAKSDDEEEEHGIPRSTTLGDSSYGVQSLDDTLAAPATNAVSEPSQTSAGAEANSLSGRKRKAGNPVHPKIAAAAQRIISGEKPSPSPTVARQVPLRRQTSGTSFREITQQGSSTSLSTPLTPLRLSPQPESAQPSTPRSGSPRSLRLSDEEGSIVDDAGSQAIQSSSGEEEDEEVSVSQIQIDTPDGPQLRMPSMTMPSRRPFTERGKRVGKLKVVVAGSAGVGKTSLIKSVVQMCEDIVHIDPPVIASGSGEVTQRQRKGTDCTVTHVGDHGRAHAFAEYNASTKAYPAWWTATEESRTSRRRRSVGGDVLDRNISFVDSQSGDGFAGQELLHWVESQLYRNCAVFDMSESDLVSLFSGGGGGVQADVVLYLIDPDQQRASDDESSDQSTGHGVEALQMKEFRQLSQLTNVIPLIARSDRMSEQEVRQAKDRFAEQYAGCQWFDFDNEKGSTEQGPSYPFAVSSAPGIDADVMDASLLMSSTYVEPLVSSDLSNLVSKLFDPENMQWLRHTAAKKFLRWRDDKSSINSLDIHLQAALSMTQPESGTRGNAAQYGTPGPPSTVSSPSGVLVPYAGSSVIRSTSSSPARQSSDPLEMSVMTLPPLHTQDQFTQVRLAKWADDLRKSLETDRRQQALRSGEGGQNTAPLGLAITEAAPEWRAKSSRGGQGNGAAIDPLDPLGIFSASSTLRRRGMLVLKILGSCGVIGAFGLWVLRRMEYEPPAFLASMIPGVASPASTATAATTSSTSFVSSSSGSVPGFEWISDLWRSTLDLFNTEGPKMASSAGYGGSPSSASTFTETTGSMKSGILNAGLGSVETSADALRRAVGDGLWRDWRLDSGWGFGRLTEFR